MIRLYQFAPALGLANASPFCLKLETWLRMAGLDYEVVITPDPRKSPLGKLPVIEHEGNKVADSSCAIAYLEKACNIKLNAQLNPGERALAHALQRMLEEHSYWALIYFRWLDDSNWDKIIEHFFADMNGLLRSIVPALVRRQLRRDAHGHGLSRHSPEELQRRFTEDMRALSDALGEKPYFGGYQPANVDATAYGFLAQVLLAGIDTPLRPLVERHRNLVNYCQQMHQRYYPELS